MFEGTFVLIYKKNFKAGNSEKLTSARFWRIPNVALYEKKIIFHREQHYFGIKWKYEGNETNVVLC